MGVFVGDAEHLESGVGERARICPSVKKCCTWRSVKASGRSRGRRWICDSHTRASKFTTVVMVKKRLPRPRLQRRGLSRRIPTSRRCGRQRRTSRPDGFDSAAPSAPSAARRGSGSSTVERGHRGVEDRVDRQLRQRLPAEDHVRAEQPTGMGKHGRGGVDPADPVAERNGSEAMSPVPQHRSRTVCTPAASAVQSSCRKAAHRWWQGSTTISS